ncbi:MAG TPA: adenosylmethionine--8-amino-7-oxononanoate transaminase [Verrucomicrobia bacterium]|nr:MAG: adenosylmethionine--8-amino-7-oxononanoate transaminase [Lentisphaerae bacterium GWF2_57_35]HBA83653.1 adenosylmethionine--8-amino-7-oxononanoate transaminase [Verrucomicrobiota bacterium]
MNTDDYISMDREHLWHPYTRFSTFETKPLPVIVRGKGLYLFDADGNRYIDAISSWWACALGHGNDRIKDAIGNQADCLQQSILGNLSHPAAIELAGKLAGLMPRPNRHVLFSSDGASAVEAALKIAVQYGHNIGQPTRRRLAYLRDAYHGDTLGAVSVGFLESFHKPFKSILFPALSIPVPYRKEDERACLAEATHLFDQHTDEIAALIVEPLCQGAAGMKMYSAQYLRQLAALCREREVLLIVDEIATGFGRTGRMFAFEHAGIDPDIVCVGKALSAGYLPISAAIVKDDIYAAFSDQPVDHTFYHGHTFCGNPIAAAAALEALRIYEEIDIAAQARRIEALLKEALTPLSALPFVTDVRCLGAIGAVELSSRELVQTAKMALLEQRILARPLGQVVYLMPPLNTPDEHIKNLVNVFAQIVRSVVA